MGLLKFLFKLLKKNKFKNGGLKNEIKGFSKRNKHNRR